LNRYRGSGMHKNEAMAGKVICHCLNFVSFALKCMWLAVVQRLNFAPSK
jgi:hypothetical protein